MPLTLDWHYDVLSPFARIALEAMRDLPGDPTIRPRATLLGALLKHWGQLGPAEVEPKRLHTYRLALHLAGRHGLDLRFPPTHPFNPLPAMRLLAGLNDAEGADLEQVRIALGMVWDEGRALDDETAIRELADRLGADPSLALADPSKSALRHTTDEAIAAGVFGVPTVVMRHDGRTYTFWGVDALPLLRDTLLNPGIMERGAMGDIANVQYGVRRRA